MYRFEYRHTRFPASLPALLETADKEFPCRCTEISIAGTRVELMHTLLPGSNCKLTLRSCTPAIEMRVRVVHTSATFSGLEFIGDRDQNQAAIAGLLASLTQQPQDRVTTMAIRPRILQSHSGR